MFLRGAIQSGTKGRRNAIFGATAVALLSMPAMMYGFDPPAYMPDLAQAQVHGCANCHGTFSGTSGISVTGVPSSYTAGGAAVNMTVSLPGGQGFYLAILDSANANAGTITAGTGSQVTAVGGVNFLIDSTSGTSWTFSWTPPATAAGTVGVYVAGGTHGTSYATSYMIPAASTGPPPLPTLTVSPSPLSFTATAGSTTALSQNVSVTASGGSGVTFSAAAATTPSGGTWLSLPSATGTTPTSTFAVSANPSGLAAGTYNGSVTFTSSGASNSPVMLAVTLTVGSSTPPPTSETFSLVVVDRQSTTTGGGDWLLLDGSGDTSKTPIGGGNFTRFRSMSRESERGGSISATTAIVANGTWQVTGVTSSAAGKLMLGVQLTTKTSSSSTMSNGTLTITDNGSCSGATLAITGGATFNSVGIGGAKLGNPGTGSCGTTGGGTGGTPPPPTPPPDN